MRVVSGSGHASDAGSRDKTLGHWLNRQWRVLATGLCFATFMLSGLFLSLWVLPLFRLIPSVRRQERSLALIQNAFCWFTKYMQWWGLIASFKIEDPHHLRDKGPFLFIANHPSLIDVVTVLGSIPRCNCIVKKALFQHRFMGGVLRQAGFLPNDSGPRFIAGARRGFQTGRSLAVFPEGTRSPLQGLRPFNRGAAQIALRTGVRVVPIEITCEPPTLMKGQAWFQVPNRPVDFVLRFHPPLAIPAEIGALEAMPLRVRALNRYFEHFYMQLRGVEKLGA